MIFHLFVNPIHIRLQNMASERVKISINLCEICASVANEIGHGDTEITYN